MDDIKKRQKEGKINASSVSFVVKRETVGLRLIRQDIMVNGRVYRVDRYLDALPDSLCGNCSTWVRIEAQCAFPKSPRCGICSQAHRTADHTCPVQGCTTKKGIVCVHVIAKCPGCKGQTPTSVPRSIRPERRPEDGEDLGGVN